MSFHPLRALLRCRKPLPRLHRFLHATRHLTNRLPATHSTVLRDIEGPDAGNYELQPLDRPLGVSQRPTTLVKGTTERMRELLIDNKALMEQRRLIVREVSKGYYYDLNMTRRHGGKTWIAPNSLIREDKALYFPNIKGTSIEENKEEKNTTTMCFGRITVLSMLNTRMSDIHTRGFVEATNARYSGHPLYQYVQINLQENMLKNLLVKLFIHSLRAVVPNHLHATYLVSNQNTEYIRDAIGMTNARVGYVYLIDEQLRIRWAGCADATTEESQALEVCTGVLLKRAERLKGKKLPEEQERSTDEGEIEYSKRYPTL